MGVGIIEGEYNKVLYCNTSMVAFGDVFSEDEDPQEFLEWLTMDARIYTPRELSQKMSEWRLMNDEKENNTNK